MPYYGIPSAGLALTASTANDTVAMANLGSTTVTAASVFGADGNDIISLAAVGRTAIATGSATLAGSGSGTISVILNGSASYTASAALTTGVPGRVVVTGVITSQQAARVINGSYLQGNAGNDSIILGDAITKISASTFAGGAGNDVIGTYNNVNNVFTASNLSAGAILASVTFEGGAGNDLFTINAPDATASALSINANAGDDTVSLSGADFNVQGNSFIGLGAGNDSFSGNITAFNTSTLAGGLGNDTIVFSSIGAGIGLQNAMLGLDRANNDSQSGDGNDLLILETEVDQSTIYGGGGNDTVTLSSDAFSGSLISLNAGNDIITANDATIFQDSYIGFGQGADLYTTTAGGTASILTSTLAMGEGNDTVNLSANISQIGLFEGATVHGGGGADNLLVDAFLAANQTSQIVLEYNSDSESTLSAFDTIGLKLAGGVSASLQFRYEPGGVTQASFSGAGVSATNGVVTFSGIPDSLTSRVSVVASNTSNGNAAVFLDGDNTAYLFVNGSSTDLVVQLGVSGMLQAGLALSVGAGKNLSVGLDSVN